MDRDRPFPVLMTEANRAMVALDDITMRDGSKATAATVRDGLRVYSELLNYRETVRMNMADISLLQTALDMLRSRLRFFGQVV